MKFKQPPQTTQKADSKSNLDREDAWMQVIECATLSLANLVNPSAGISIFLLKLCFQILKVLRHHHRP
ncbi:hypothetical protein [Alkalinema sp. FACHB-956]|uniref:hypothetical protein n=1 Tax=Alkalinema sp. FACHB-956 TaxID=2692768 RepID=UPI00168A1A38|nr:hypothetical protein [Alkalinema sp. FACHB-956]MBD2328917.1 hypothetical protein [Alkalinema sp. FACHB-956]